jgi:S-adenosyl-L-methionine hydrolase (adenosine-forming)
MSRPIALFTDFGLSGPYLGQVIFAMNCVAPGAAVVNLMADAPACDPRSSAYLLAALTAEIPADAVVFAVVDPGVGGRRAAMVAELDGRLLVGPDNGLFEPAMRRAANARAWEIVWRPERLSATFHGRDLFAPMAARLAAGEEPQRAGCREMEVPFRPDWPDDLAAIVYLDHYGNGWTGLRASKVPKGAQIGVGGRRLGHARTYGDVPAGAAFWYENSSGLVEVAVNGGRAESALALSLGMAIEIL